MLSVAEAKTRILASLKRLPAETISLAEADGRVLADDVKARITQPPWPASAMDGYAVRGTDVAHAPAALRQIGIVHAGGCFEGGVGPGQTVRIFTGAPMPTGADTVVIQENVEAEGEHVRVLHDTALGRNVRPAGLDFKTGEIGLEAGRRLNARAIGFAAAMNVPWLRVTRKPRVAVLATGDEIVMPGEPVGANQIVSSNALALIAAIRRFGGEPINLGIALDDEASLRTLAAGASGADLLVTTGGASVGEHDLVRDVLGGVGLKLDFWKIAMRPGKPLMFGRLGETHLLGLPGNPVSTLVCAILFLKPAISRLLGLSGDGEMSETAVLGVDLAANDERQDYLRASLRPGPDGTALAAPFSKQDSAMMSLMANAGCLIIRPPRAPAAKAGGRVPIIRLDDV
ncbi:MAG: molybdopterin molybdenumtransferase MoeA [Alphaproteobacteria bacterium]|nr:molybdopterin molybdenumtransferase MoeA [Alphaproteobacteria bacterium]